MPSNLLPSDLGGLFLIAVRIRTDLIELIEGQRKSILDEKLDNKEQAHTTPCRAV